MKRRNLFLQILFYSMILNSILFSQNTDLVKVVFKKGDNIREISRQQLGDPNLWEDILNRNNISSPDNLFPGTELIIPRDEIKNCEKAVREASARISSATNSGARLFAEKLIDESISLYDKAVIERKKGNFAAAIVLAQQSLAKSEAAIEAAAKNRDVSGEAALTARKGKVENRGLADQLWRELMLQSKLAEGEKIRTLSKSYAEITFQDGNRIRLNENAQAVIQKMRVDLLEKKNESSVSLVEGDAFALLAGGNSGKKKFNFEIPGVKTKINSKSFWIKKDPQDTKIANYDGEIELVSSTQKVLVKENQGVKLDKNQNFSKPRDLLPRVILKSPAPGSLIYAAKVKLEWEEVKNSIKYWLEVASDPDFKNQLIVMRDIKTADIDIDRIADGQIYWRVSAIDFDGIPGPVSKASSFNFISDTKGPFLSVSSPKDDLIIAVDSLTVSGTTDNESKLFINGNPLDFNEDGFFSTEYKLESGINLIVIESFDRAGNKSELKRKIFYDPEDEINILYEGDLVYLGSGRYMINKPEFKILGKTKPQCKINFYSSDSAISLRSFSDIYGNFDLKLQQDSLIVKYFTHLISRAGNTVLDSIEIIKDQIPPKAEFLDIIPDRTSNSSILLRMMTSEVCRIRINGREVESAASELSHKYDLQSGSNRLVFEITDIADNLAKYEFDIYRDDLPPGLVKYEINPVKSDLESYVVQIYAEDESGLQKKAEVKVSYGNRQGTEFLIYNDILKRYEGTIKLPYGAQSPLRIGSVTLTDYLGNSRDYPIEHK